MAPEARTAPKTRRARKGASKVKPSKKSAPAQPLTEFYLRPIVPVPRDGDFIYIDMATGVKIVGTDWSGPISNPEVVQRLRAAESWPGITLFELVDKPTYKERVESEASKAAEAAALVAARAALARTSPAQRMATPVAMRDPAPEKTPTEELATAIAGVLTKPRSRR